MPQDDSPAIRFDGRIDSHPMHKAIYDLMQEIEKLPASDQQTKVVTLAGNLQHGIASMRAVYKDNAAFLSRYAKDTFPVDAAGKKHFARIIMESAAQGLEEAYSPEK